MEIITKSEKETQEFAKNFAQSLNFGDVLALTGELGSGKTAFAKGIAAAIGIKDHITSPTFVILKNYEIKNYKLKIKNLVHIDCYRINGIDDAESIGLNEYFESKDNVVIIEWAENIQSILPKRTKHIKLENLGADKRKISY